MLFANKDGKYSFTANTASTTVSISGVRKIEPTPAPMITYTETATGITFTAAGEGEVVLYVNNKPVSNPYTLEWSDGETVFAVSATAQAAGSTGLPPPAGAYPRTACAPQDGRRHPKVGCSACSHEEESQVLHA